MFLFPIQSGCFEFVISMLVIAVVHGAQKRG